MLWVSVLEQGFNFNTIVFKGLELQETSCHTEEASRVEENFELAFDSAKSRFNPVRPYLDGGVTNSDIANV